MLKADTKDFLYSEIDDYSLISIKSKKLKVLIIGGGRAGYIKAKAFQNRGSKVFVLSKDFSTEFNQIKNLGDITLIKDSYKKEYIIDKHLIVIATGDEVLNEIIRQHCDNLYKIYIDSSSKGESLAYNTCQRETKTMVLGLNNKISCPKLTVFLADKLKNELSQYDEFVSYVTDLRKKLIDEPKKDEIMNFLCSDDFYYFFTKGYGEHILRLFYGGNKW